MATSRVGRCRPYRGQKRAAPGARPVRLVKAQRLEGRADLAQDALDHAAEKEQRRDGHDGNEGGMRAYSAKPWPLSDLKNGKNASMKASSDESASRLRPS